MPEPEPEPELEPDQTPRRARSRSTGIIFGGLVGCVLGVIAGIVLLAFSHSAPSLSHVTDPVTLWNSIGDPLVRTAAILIAAGFALLGIGLGAWSRRGPS